MCYLCLFDEMHGPYGDIFGGYGGGGNFRAGFAPVSAKAQNAENDAQAVFLNHLANVDVSKGSVTTEIIQSHLVQDMRTKFNKFVKGYGCTAKSRQITREEQNAIPTYKNRKSLVHFTSVTVTKAAQDAYFAKNPSKKPATSASASAGASGSGIGGASASTSGSGSLRDARGNNKAPIALAPVDNLTLKRKANQAELDVAPVGTGLKKAKKA